MITTDVETNNATKRCTEVVKGSCHLFWVERTGRLRFELVIRNRVLPSDVVHAERYGRSDLFYLECCNVVNTKTKMMGTLCAVVRSNVPKLCVIHHLDLEKDEGVLLEWIGQVLITAGKNRFVPDFYLNHKDNYDQDLFDSTFVVRRVKLRETRMIFLNQVSGYKPYLDRVTKKRHYRQEVDIYDGCFHASIEGPDIISIPLICKG